MYLIINDDKENVFELTRRIKAANSVKYVGMPDIPDNVSGSIVMCTDSGMRLSADNADDYARQEYGEDYLLLTNEPEPEPPEPGPEPSGDYVKYGELAEAIREGVNSIE